MSEQVSICVNLVCHTFSRFLIVKLCEKNWLVRKSQLIRSFFSFSPEFWFVCFNVLFRPSGEFSPTIAGQGLQNFDLYIHVLGTHGNWAVRGFSARALEVNVYIVCVYINKRPMGHIAHLRKQFKLINTYDYIITLIKRRDFFNFVNVFSLFL